MSTTKPEPGLVSVIVPTYNVAATLDQCLASIEGQTHQQVEVIVVNDGSTDESSAIAHAHAARDQRFRHRYRMLQLFHHDNRDNRTGGEDCFCCCFPVFHQDFLSPDLEIKSS